MDEPVRILNLFTIMNRGGAETMVMNYYRKIDKTKVQFDFMVHRQERGAYDDEIEAMGGHIYRMCPIYPQNIFRYKQLLKDFFDAHPEYRILHSHMSELGYFAFKEAVRHRVPVRICHAHNAPVFKNETWKERLSVLPREWLARRMRRLSTDYFTCSQVAGEWLFGSKNVKRLQFMPNAIDVNSFAYNAQKALEIKEQYGWKNNIVVGHVGRFCPQKNHAYLIEIFNSFHEKFAQSILVLVGSGELMSSIKQKVSELGLDKCVFFMGNQTNMPCLYWTFDVFLFPSFYEGLPVSLIEAQAAGLPCVTSDAISQQAKLLDCCKTLSLSDDVRLWVDAMASVLKQKRKDTSREIKKAGFDIETNAEWLTQYYINRFKENA